MRHKYHLVIGTVFIIMGSTMTLIAQGNGITQAKVLNLPSVAGAVDIVSLAYPSELFFGDTFYCQFIRKNNKEAPMRVVDSLPISGLAYSSGIRFIISAEGIDETYTVVPEKDFYRYDSWAIPQLFLQPDASLVSSYPLEFPPLEAMVHPFWKQLREKMATGGVQCVLSIQFSGYYIVASNWGNWGPINDVEREKYAMAGKALCILTHEIIIKPRPNQEQALLDGWLRDTPKQFLPPLSRTVDYAQKWYSPEMNAFEKDGWRQHGGHFVEINGREYNPWCFIRDGNRKPPAQICPRTSEEWHQLEKSLEPSTMRDEIQLTRMLLEYLGAEEDAQIRKREELVQWLKSLPEPQSMSMASNLSDEKTMYAMYSFRVFTPAEVQERIEEIKRMDTNEALKIEFIKRIEASVALKPAAGLGKSYHELLKELRPMMSHYHKQEFDRQDEWLKKREENQAK